MTAASATPASPVLPPAAALTAGATSAVPTGVVLDGELLASVQVLIAAARQHVAQSVNTTLVLLYGEVGDRLRREVLQDGRAAYGRPAVERLDGEGRPLGRILCADESEERVELLELEGRGVQVARYFLELPPRDEWRRQLHRAVERARARVAVGESGGEVQPAHSRGDRTSSPPQQ